MLGIYDCFGYDVPFENRYQLIKAAGFDSVMLWWSDRFGRGEGYQKDVRYARDAGLFIENIHAPVHEQDFLSMNNQDGESVFQSYLQCVKDCFDYAIDTMVIHLPSDDYPINALGLERIEIIIRNAEESQVKVAFENLRNIQNLDFVLRSVSSENAGFCYDSCHHKNYAPDIDLLERYRNRLMALHLHDNGGRRGQHQLPFDGSIDWEAVVKKIANTGYKGTTALEPMNWGYENLSIRKFLSRAHQTVRKLNTIRQGESL